MKNLLWLIMLLSWTGLFAQESGPKVNHYSLKKGEVFDLLFLNQHPGSDSLFKEYVKTVFPYASKLSYRGMPGFRVKKTVFGNIQPGALILGRWDSQGQRETFLETIEEDVPDFHDRRLAIWPSFYLTYYPLEEDLEFSVDKSKCYTATAYWGEKAGKTSQYAKQQIADMQALGGQTVVMLKNGSSPFRYIYNPTVFVISVWENEAAFSAYKQAHPDFDAFLPTFLAPKK